jgi:hypothetical protein
LALEVAAVIIEVSMSSSSSLFIERAQVSDALGASARIQTQVSMQAPAALTSDPIGFVLDSISEDLNVAVAGLDIFAVASGVESLAAYLNSLPEDPKLGDGYRPLLQSLLELKRKAQISTELEVLALLQALGSVTERESALAAEDASKAFELLVQLVSLLGTAASHNSLTAAAKVSSLHTICFQRNH